MRRFVLLAVLLLAATACGCEAVKNDRILGDSPWHPTLGIASER